MKNFEIVVDEEWEWYIGQLFYQVLKEIKKPEVVVELAPGFRHKIALALKEIDFNGEIFIIDSNPQAIEYVKEKYKEILPNANINCICKSFCDAFSFLPEKIDLFLANHALDDMIIEQYISKEKYNSLHNCSYDNDLFMEAWKSLIKNDEERKRIPLQIYSLFKKFFSEKDVEFAVISQYRSNKFFLGKDDEIDNMVRNCFNLIKDDFDNDTVLLKKALSFLPFGNDERYLGKELLDNTQNHKNWIAGKPKYK